MVVNETTRRFLLPLGLANLLIVAVVFLPHWCTGQTVDLPSLSMMRNKFSNLEPKDQCEQLAAEIQLKQSPKVIDKVRALRQILDELNSRASGEQYKVEPKGFAQRVKGAIRANAATLIGHLKNCLELLQLDANTEGDNDALEQKLAEAEKKLATQDEEISRLKQDNEQLKADLVKINGDKTTKSIENNKLSQEINQKLKKCESLVLEVKKRQDGEQAECKRELEDTKAQLKSSDSIKNANLNELRTCRQDLAIAREQSEQSYTGWQKLPEVSTDRRFSRGSSSRRSKLDANDAFKYTWYALVKSAKVARGDNNVEIYDGTLPHESIKETIDKMVQKFVAEYVATRKPVDSNSWPQDNYIPNPRSSLHRLETLESVNYAPERQMHYGRYPSYRNNHNYFYPTR